MTVFVQPADRPDNLREQVAVIPTGVRAEVENGRLSVYDVEDRIVGDFGAVVWWFAGHMSPVQEAAEMPSLASIETGP
jgi:hypothetical protein